MDIEQTTTVVRYNPVVGLVVLVLGVLNTVLAVLQVARGDGVGFLLFLGLVFDLLGVLLLTRPYLRIDSERVEILGPLVGSTRYPYRTLEIEGGVPIAVGVDGTRRRVAAQRWFARRAHWDAMVEEIGRGRWSRR